MLVLDTNALIYFSRGEPLVGDFLLARLKDNEKVIISLITLIEFLSYPAITEAEEDFFVKLLPGLLVEGVDITLALQAVKFRKHYHLKLGDSIVAALASTKQAALVSRDKDFRRIKEIDVVEI